MIKLQIKNSNTGKEVNFEAENYTAEECGRMIIQLTTYMHGGALNKNGVQRIPRDAPSPVRRTEDAIHTDIVKGKEL
ncbi:hypothetical protein M5E02_14515 [Bacillus safensis]|uniref:hypothetical protein n=1 Tax=Bacillus safensis TaxID=561879 RepID=UPI0020755852|nr:hypothetical protein [Bacillus safensis]USD81967.1 hypothetical protein M5E02_14515 [Bacillus safensis]